MANLNSLIPNAEDVLSLEPEELAGVLLQHLNSLPEAEKRLLSRHNFGQPNTVREYPPQHQEELIQALMEAWWWLDREGLLVPKPAASGSFYFISRRGKKLTTAEDVARYRRETPLPKRLLHPRIAQKTWASFLRGDYETAVFQAFKELEIGVRKAGGFTAEDYGVKLMRKAFSATDGCLRDKSLPKPERESIAHLFAGAIGAYKNAHSHRDVSLGAEETVELLMLATHLIGLVERRAEMRSAT